MSDNYNDNDFFHSDHGHEVRSDRYDDISSPLKNETRYDEGSYTYTSENSSKTNNKKKSHFVLKCIAAVLALAILGTGTVQVYKFLNDTKDELAEFSGKPSKAVINPEATAADKNEEPLPSLIDLASRSDAKQIPDIVDSIMPSVVGVAYTF